MQVILVKSVRKLGKVGDKVNVKDGYGRNYLIPQDFAIRATRDNVELFAQSQQELEKKNTEAKLIAEATAQSLDGKAITFVLQSAADGRLFGSVSAKLLSAKLSEMTGNVLNYSNILLESPIKINGVYDVKISLHSEVQASVLVVIAKSESEANDALRDYKEGKKVEIEEENSSQSSDESAA